MLQVQVLKLLICMYCPPDRETVTHIIVCLRLDTDNKSATVICNHLNLQNNDTGFYFCALTLDLLRPLSLPPYRTMLNGLLSANMHAFVFQVDHHLS